MKHPLLALTPCLLCLGLLAACSSSGVACGDPHPYTQSVNGPKLKAPPGLTLPAPDPAYLIPAAGSAAAPAAVNGPAPCMAEPPNILPPRAVPAASRAKPNETPPPSPASKPAPPVATGGPME